MTYSEVAWHHANQKMQEFLTRSKQERDVIAVRRSYVDMACGELGAGVLLSQIVYWHEPDDEGNSRLRVEKDGHLWIAKGRSDWWEECRITAKQFDHYAEILEANQLIYSKLYRFAGSPTKHVRLNPVGFFAALDFVTQHPKTIYDIRPRDKQGKVLGISKQLSKNGISPKGKNKRVKTELEFEAPGNLEMTFQENGTSPKGKIQFPQIEKSILTKAANDLTEITTETTPETTPETTSLPTLSQPPKPEEREKKQPDPKPPKPEPPSTPSPSLPIPRILPTPQTTPSEDHTPPSSLDNHQTINAKIDEPSNLDLDTTGADPTVRPGGDASGLDDFGHSVPDAGLQQRNIVGGSDRPTTQREITNGLRSVDSDSRVLCDDSFDTTRADSNPSESAVQQSSIDLMHADDLCRGDADRDGDRATGKQQVVSDHAAPSTTASRYQRNQKQYPKNIDGSDRLPWEIPGARGKYDASFENWMARSLVRTPYYEKLTAGELIREVRKHISQGKYDLQRRDKLLIEWESMQSGETSECNSSMTAKSALRRAKFREISPNEEPKHD